MKNAKKNIIIIICTLLVTVGLIFLMTKTKSSSSFKNMPQRGVNIPSVKSQEAKVLVLNDYLITNGEVESQSSIEVFPSMSGKIASINVMLGSSVKKGDVIAKVDPSEPGTNFALSPVTAPVSGSIVSSPLKVGTKVTQSTPVTIIGDVENLQITANVPERYVAELKVGLKAEITLEAYPSVIFNATVSRVSPVVDKATRTKEVILVFDKKDSRINAGMFAKVKLYTSKYSGSVVVSKEAIIEQDEDSYIYVVNDDESVSKRIVKLGKTVDEMIQITDNLVSGERVVVEGILSLAEGIKVNDISNPKKIESMQDTNNKTGGN